MRGGEHRNCARLRRKVSVREKTPDFVEVVSILHGLSRRGGVYFIGCLDDVGRYLLVRRVVPRASLLPKPVPCMLPVVCFNTPDCEPP
jgi:hypothetical protein